MFNIDDIKLDPETRRVIQGALKEFLNNPPPSEAPCVREHPPLLSPRPAAPKPS